LKEAEEEKRLMNKLALLKREQTEMQDRVHEMVTGKKKEPEKTAAEKQAD